MYIKDGSYIRKGRSSYGDVVFNIDGNYIREGRSSYGDVVFYID